MSSVDELLMYSLGIVIILAFCFMFLAVVNGWGHDASTMATTMDYNKSSGNTTAYIAFPTKDVNLGCCIVKKLEKKVKRK